MSGDSVAYGAKNIFSGGIAGAASGRPMDLLDPLNFRGGASPSTPELPDPPKTPSPAEQPDPEDILITKRKRRQAAAANKTGRASTILSDAMNRRDTLGG